MCALRLSSLTHEKVPRRGEPGPGGQGLEGCQVFPQRPSKLPNCLLCASKNISVPILNKLFSAYWICGTPAPGAPALGWGPRAAGRGRGCASGKKHWSSRQRKSGLLRNTSHAGVICTRPGRRACQQQRPTSGMQRPCGGQGQSLRSPVLLLSAGSYQKRP